MAKNTIEKAIYNRTELLLGDDVMEALAAVRVIIFGVGGVGSWCAEGLVRSGITKLTIVDSDRISEGEGTSDPECHIKQGEVLLLAGCGAESGSAEDQGGGVLECEGMSAGGGAEEEDEKSQNAAGQEVPLRV